MDGSALPSDYDCLDWTFDNAPGLDGNVGINYNPNDPASWTYSVAKSPVDCVSLNSLYCFEQ
jgi:hypothetical protein